MGSGRAEDILQESTLVRALGECLEALDRGETNIEALVECYPQVKQELRPLLEIAGKLREQGADGNPSTSFLLRLRRQLLDNRH